MNESLKRTRILVMAAAAVAIACNADAQQQAFVQFAGAPCATPPVLHCPDADCAGDRVINQGPVVEMKTRRTYFLDIYDRSRQNPPNPSWGLLPRPGKAQVYVYPNCKDGRVVADVVRLEKGHTEGLEPKVTEELITLMLSANGGKIQHAR